MPINSIKAIYTIFNTKNEDPKYTAEFDFYAYNAQRYEDGYFYAALSLIENMHDKNDMVYPTLYLCTHYLEIAIKRLIRLTYAVNMKEPAKEILNGHDLEKLFSVFQAEGGVYIRRYADLAKNIASTINEINQYANPKGEKDKGYTRYPYRYSNLTPERRPIDNSITTLDLLLLRDCICEVYHFIHNVAMDCTDTLIERGQLEIVRLFGNDMRAFENDFAIKALDPKIKI